MEPLQNQNIAPSPVNMPSDFSQPSPVNRNVLSGNNHKKVGPIVATLIIILVIIIGALYIFASKVNQQAPTDSNSTALNANSQVNQNNNIAPTPTPVATVAPVTGTADDLNSLQADLNASVKGVDGQGI